MAQLPSYQDAVSRLDWLELVGPYFEYRDFANLCSVNNRFYAVFAPRLWNDPLVTVRQLGLKPSDDLEWYLDFVFDRMRHVRPSTLAFITTLDYRSFAKDTAHFSSDDSTKTISETLRRLPSILPNLRCVLLDGHAEADPAFLTTASTPPPAVAESVTHDQRLLVLGMAQCKTRLPSAFFTSDKFQHLVYLDVSGLPGSLQPLLAAAHGRRHLARLKILKARRREINDALAAMLFQAFKCSLWSLDMSENNVTDAILDQFVASCFNSPSLRSQSRFKTEGRLVSVGHGNDSYGRFMSIQESDHSRSFNHPERHFVDAPIYSADTGRDLQEDEAVRSNGKTPLRQDTVDHVKTAVARTLWPDVPHLDVCRAPAGITHLHLSDTHITTAGVERLLRMSQGQIEELSCNGMLFRMEREHGVKQSLPWPKGARLYGAPGSAYVFRPVISSNLRTLTIHHSLVTQVPTLIAEGLSTMASIHIAENDIKQRAEMAFPGAFEPDMNPRLTSLTLTQIPRRSSGHLIMKLLRFFELLGLQERAIRYSLCLSSHRSPVLLRGLRHLRLEFEADPMEDPAGWSTSDDLDAEALMNMHEGEGFSFFGDERPQTRGDATKKKAAAGNTSSIHLPSSPADLRNRFPFTESNGGYMDFRDTWAGRSCVQRVFIGTGVVGSDKAVNEYMKLITKPSLRSRIGPASPAQVTAGIPEGALLFHAAWDAMVMPTGATPPQIAEIQNMRDVLEALKTFRLQSRAEYEAAKKAAVGDARAEHSFWSGRLEVSVQQSMAHYRAHSYWR